MSCHEQISNTGNRFIHPYQCILNPLPLDRNVEQKLKLEFRFRPFQIASAGVKPLSFVSAKGLRPIKGTDESSEG